MSLTHEATLIVAMAEAAASLQICASGRGESRVFTGECPTCKSTYRGSTAKTVRTSLLRHIGEEHTAGGANRKRKRLAAASDYKDSMIRASGSSKKKKKETHILASGSGQKKKYIAYCTECEKTFTASKETTARRSLRRHVDEEHSKGKTACKKRRLASMCRYKESVYRREKPQDARASGPSGVSVFVVCADLRETRDGMFSTTRGLLMDKGFESANIRRLHGVDVVNPPRGFNSTDLRPSNFLTKYFLTRFVPMAEEKLKEPGVKAVCWAEDDCKLKSGVNAEDIAKEIEDAAPAASWLGYYKVGGAPRWGAHLIGFNSSSLPRFVEAARELYERTPLSLDTTLFQLLASRQRGPDGIVKAATQSMALQRPHDLKGRRLHPKSRR